MLYSAIRLMRIGFIGVTCLSLKAPLQSHPGQWYRPDSVLIVAKGTNKGHWLLSLLEHPTSLNQNNWLIKKKEVLKRTYSAIVGINPASIKTQKCVI